MSAHVTSVNGIELYYESYGERHGEGDPLLLLHGFFGSSEVWSPFIERFSAHFRLVVPDLRGHGRTSNPARVFTHRQCARDIFALLDRLEIPRVKAIGHSTGGMTLLHMATQQPERIDAMILRAATHYFPESCREVQAGAIERNRSEESLERHRVRHKRGDEQIRALVQAFHDMKDSYDDMNFTPPYLGTIKAKTLIVHGDRDKLFPVDIPQELYRSIPDSYLWIVPNAGHGFSEFDQEQFAATAISFLSGGFARP